MTENKIVCIWPVGGVECNGEVKQRYMFNGSVQIPICDTHMDVHKDIMRLGRYYDGGIIVSALEVYSLQDAKKYLRFTKGMGKRTILKDLKSLKKANKQRRQKRLENL